MGRPTVRTDIRTLIRQMANANPRWGAPRIHGELLKLGIDVCQATVAKYLVRGRRPPSRSKPGAPSCGITSARSSRPISSSSRLRPTVSYSCWCSSPTIGASLSAPRSRSRVRQSAGHGTSDGNRGRAHGAPRALANPFVERFIGSARRECVDHVIVFSEAGLLKLMAGYRSYYERSRTHLSLDKDTPIPRLVTPPGDGAIVAIPQVGGLHHRYERRAA